MLDDCLYCGQRLSRRGEPNVPREGVRLAFDPSRRRVWSVCHACHGWNLWWRDRRWLELERLERSARDRARVLYETDHVALLEADGRQLIRVGPALRREEAWWRYGRKLRQRHDRYQNPLRRAGASVYSAVSKVGTSVGLQDLTGDFRDATNRYVDVLRWRRFGRTAWAGRAPCPHCNSALIRLFFIRVPELVLIPAEGGAATVGMPCTRCDPWTEDRTYRFDTATSEPVLRRALAWENIAGATGRELDRAVRLIETASTASEFVEELARERRPLRSLSRPQRLALEIAVNEGAERRRLANHVAALEAGWRQADEIAGIIEEEL